MFYLLYLTIVKILNHISSATDSLSLINDTLQFHDTFYIPLCQFSSRNFFIFYLLTRCVLRTLLRFPIHVVYFIYKMVICVYRSSEISFQYFPFRIISSLICSILRFTINTGKLPLVIVTCRTVTPYIYTPYICHDSTNPPQLYLKNLKSTRHNIMIVKAICILDTTVRSNLCRVTKLILLRILLYFSHESGIEL